MADINKRYIPPPPAEFATNDPVFNRWLHDVTSRSQLLNGTAVPDPKRGINGDWYCNTTAKHIYVKIANAWVLIV
jgi:hypothetical protein